MDSRNEYYANDAKLLWRRKLWAEIQSACKGYMESVAIMPGAADHEVGVLESLGIPTEGTHLIDHTAAVVATHRKRRPKLGGTYGLTVARAFERMAADGVELDAAHLDFCSCVTPSVLLEIGHAIRSKVIRPGGALAVTVLRGREHGEIKARFDEAERWDEAIWRFPGGYAHDPMEEWDGGPSGIQPTQRDRYRASAITDAAALAASNYGVRVTAHGAYQSGAGSQTMYWLVIQVGGACTGHLDGQPPGGYTEGWLAVADVQGIGSPAAHELCVPEEATGHEALSAAERAVSWEPVVDHLRPKSIRGHGRRALRKLAWMGEPHLLDAMELLCVGPRTADRLKEAYARWVFGGELPDAPDEG